MAWLVAANGAGTPEKGDAASTRAVAEAAPGYAVEDFAYPQADKVLEEEGILLKRGDGHIVLAECAPGTGQLEVYSRVASSVCFEVTGASGWLTMEIPSVYGVKANEYQTEVDMTVGEEEKSFDVPANSWKAVGESADEQGRPHMLVEIRTSK
ncbi:hypothetical protein B1H29_16135 [Streptomyces pactum]|uniref:Secreted protein n=1 Tax=Streptomyces pactum TaxID=68249 RepID=A0A1S6JJT8_9ACTN|nr:hypothetical protein B1H29_16135 [Streptomyces pactum]